MKNNLKAILIILVSLIGCDIHLVVFWKEVWNCFICWIKAVNNMLLVKKWDEKSNSKTAINIYYVMKYLVLLLFAVLISIAATQWQRVGTFPGFILIFSSVGMVVCLTWLYDSFISEARIYQYLKKQAK